MNNKAIVVTTTDNTHQYKHGILTVKSNNLVPVKSLDNRILLRYMFDCSIFVPDGVLGIILPPQGSEYSSLSQVGSYILPPGLHSQPSISYKINTDAMPSVFEKEDFCASIVFVYTGSPYAKGKGIELETKIIPAKTNATDSEVVVPDEVTCAPEEQVNLEEKPITIPG